MTTSQDRAATDAAESTLRGSVPPLREWVRIYLVGIFMGSADGVPGVSGGTVALIAGVYERLIEAITGATPQRGLDLLSALSPLGDGVATGRVVAILDDLDVWFLAALGAGIATAVVTMSHLVEYASETYPVLLFGLFFGLIAASAGILLREISVRRPDEIGAAVAGFLLAFAVSGIPNEDGSGGSLLVVFVAGAIAVSAMILPGISGSLLLVILGQYTRMFGVLSTFTDRLAALATGGSVGSLFEPGTLVVTFIAGGVVGLLTISRVVDRALDRNRGATLAFLVALVVGALRAPVEEIRQDPEVGGFTVEIAGAFLAAAAVGAVLVIALDHYAVDIDLTPE